MGKTHLIQAVGNAILAKNKNARVVYATSEQFVQEFLDAIRYKKITDFAGHYRYEPRPVAVARGNEKGRVERAIRYVRDNFFAACRRRLEFHLKPAV